MSKYIKTQDSSDPWLIDESNQLWTLGKKATISVANEAAIQVGFGNNDNVIELRGDLDAQGAGSEGLRIEGDGTSVDIAGSSHITAEDGIYNTSTGSLIENAGFIDGGDRGIASDSGIEVINGGRIAGDAAISLLGDSEVTNLKGGLIEGGLTGVRISTFGEAHIENYGRIVADGLAVQVNSAGDSYLLNEGRIVGDIGFGSGNDTINNVEGKVRGEIAGGLGDDNYYVGKNKAALVENLDGGYDQVYSYTSRTLGENFEDIYLLGDKNINASGNSQNNYVYGNPSDNVLRGKDGHDYVEGHAGDDILIGGDGTDYFIFRGGYDRDTVADFDAAEDVLIVIGMVDDFAALAPLISQHGDDTWISFGGGDRLILKDFAAGDLVEDSVLFHMPS